MRGIYRLISIACALLLVFAIGFPGAAKAETLPSGVVKTETQLRKDAGSGNESITTLAAGTGFCVAAEKTAEDGSLWYQVQTRKEGAALEGYVLAEHVLVADAAFMEYLTVQGFPQSYHAGLITLHAAYPNWEFYANHTSLTWNAVVAGESVRARNLVSASSDPRYIDLTDVDENGNQIGRDGSKWVSASKMAVEYYLDPRNFLTDPRIFMFESLSYTENAYTKTGVEAILKGTFMAGNYTCPDTQEVKNYADTFLEAGQLAGVSPYHLAARAKQEQGTNGNALGKGTVDGYANYFNFYNIGAYATSSGGATLNGAKYASQNGSYGRPWTNQYKSLIGGGQFLGSSYILVGQDTVYYQKFNVVNKANLYNHQYMSNIKAPYSESSTIKKGYTEEILQGKLIFEIPVYEQMPEDPIPKPEDRKVESEGGNGNENAGGNTGGETGGGNTGGETGGGNTGGETSGDTPTPQPPQPADTTYTMPYTAKDGLLTGSISLGMDAATLLQNVSVTNGNAALFDANGAAKTSGSIKTGDVLKILKADGTEQVSMSIVLYGDASGDGNVTMADLVFVRKHLLKLEALQGNYYAAADINHDGALSMADLVFVRKHLLKLEYIKQS